MDLLSTSDATGLARRTDRPRDPRRAGPPAPLLVGAILGGLLLLLTAEVTTGGPITRWDRGVTAFVVSHRTPGVDAVASAVTALGSVVILGASTVVVAVLMWFARARTHALVLVSAMLGASCLTVLGKDVVGRARPPAADVVGGIVEQSYSFPSGHTLSSAVFIAVLLALGLPRVRRGVLRVALSTLGAGLALLIGASRVYLGFHWLSDVLAGWCIAGLWITALLALTRAARGEHRLH